MKKDALNVVLCIMLMCVFLSMTGCEPAFELSRADYFRTVAISFTRHFPALIAWLVGIVFGVQMLRWGGGKMELLFLVGCGLMFAQQLISPFLSGLTQWLVSEQGFDRIDTAGLVLSLPNIVLSVSGIICLVYAFWMRFIKVKQHGA